VRNWSNPHHEALQGKLASRRTSELDSASLTLLRVASLSKRMKPDIGGRATGEAAIELSGVVGGGAWG